MFLYEIHMHTRETSRCGESDAAQMVKIYADLGFSGLVVTDHFVNGYSKAAFPELWEDKVDAFLQGYRAAKKAGDALKIPVYLGWEYTLRRPYADDYLTLGLDEAFLYRAKDCHKWRFEEYAQAVHESGGILIHAHPFRHIDYCRDSYVAPVGLVDAAEVYNGGNEEDKNDFYALQYALDYHLPQTAGSDTHHVRTTNLGCIGFDENPADYRQLCSLIRSGKCHLIENPKVY